VPGCRATPATGNMSPFSRGKHYPTKTVGPNRQVTKLGVSQAQRHLISRRRSVGKKKLLSITPFLYKTFRHRRDNFERRAFGIR
jgi:hypothetical protein